MYSAVQYLLGSLFFSFCRFLFFSFSFSFPFLLGDCWIELHGDNR